MLEEPCPSPSTLHLPRIESRGDTDRNASPGPEAQVRGPPEGRKDWRASMPAQGARSTAGKQKEGFSGSCPDLGPNLVFVVDICALPLSKESSVYWSPHSSPGTPQSLSSS